MQKKGQHSKHLKPLKEYAAIGFDLDHCLVRYNLKEFITVPYESYVKIMKDENTHHEELSILEKKDISFMQNGLIIDLNKGNILKLGKDLLILKAYHGFTKLSQEEIESQYGGRPAKYHKFDVENLSNSDYFACITYFQNQLPPFFAKLVEIHESKNEILDGDKYRAIFKSIHLTLSKNYHHFNKDVYHSPTEYGYYFKEIIDNRDKHIIKQTKMLEALKHLKEKGKILFIISNSHFEPTHYLMDHAYGEGWRDLFTFVVSKAHKPEFWETKNHSRPFKTIDHSEKTKLGKEVTLLTSNETHLEGNVKFMEESIDKILGHNNGNILYLGDQYVTDCIITEKNNPRWNTVCIMEEMEGVDFGDLYDESIFGDYFSEQTEEHGEVETFWWNYVRNNVAAVTSAVDAKEMLEFYYQE